MNKFTVNINAQTGKRTEIPISDADWEILLANQTIEIKKADWDTLYNRLLGGNLSSIFNRVNLAAITNPSITIGLLNMNGAITNVRVEQSLASALQILKLSGYVFTDQEIMAWNNAIAELNFSDLVKL